MRCICGKELTESWSKWHSNGIGRELTSSLTLVCSCGYKTPAPDNYKPKRWTIHDELDWWWE